MRRRDVLALSAVAAAVVLPACGHAVGPAADETPLVTPTFAESVATIQATIAADRSDPRIDPVALPRFYHHGKPTADAVVMYHGFTSCPQQFDMLARRFYERGANVYVPRTPLHGYRDRLTRALSDLSIAQLAIATTEPYRLARGLGQRVSVVGLSLGGSMALYLAQTQAVDHAVAIAPFLMIVNVPHWLGLGVMNVIARLPDRYTWWDPRLKEKCLPLYAYPGFPTHALAQCIFFGKIVVDGSHDAVAPRGRRCTLVTNANESAINNSVATGVLNAWKAGGTAYDHVVLEGLPHWHDIIDPTTFAPAPTLIYPRIEQIVLGA